MYSLKRKDFSRFVKSCEEANPAQLYEKTFPSKTKRVPYYVKFLRDASPLSEIAILLEAAMSELAFCFNPNGAPKVRVLVHENKIVGLASKAISGFVSMDQIRFPKEKDGKKYNSVLTVDNLLNNQSGFVPLAASNLVWQNADWNISNWGIDESEKFVGFDYGFSAMPLCIRLTYDNIKLNTPRRLAEFTRRKGGRIRTLDSYSEKSFEKCFKINNQVLKAFPILDGFNWITYQLPEELLQELKKDTRLLYLVFKSLLNALFFNEQVLRILLAKQLDDKIFGNYYSIDDLKKRNLDKNATLLQLLVSYFSLRRNKLEQFLFANNQFLKYINNSPKIIDEIIEGFQAYNTFYKNPLHQINIEFIKRHYARMRLKARIILVRGDIDNDKSFLDNIVDRLLTPKDCFWISDYHIIEKMVLAKYTCLEDEFGKMLRELMRQAALSFLFHGRFLLAHNLFEQSNTMHLSITVSKQIELLTIPAYDYAKIVSNQAIANVIAQETNNLNKQLKTAVVNLLTWGVQLSMKGVIDIAHELSRLGMDILTEAYQLFCNSFKKNETDIENFNKRATEKIKNLKSELANNKWGNRYNFFKAPLTQALVTVEDELQSQCTPIIENVCDI